MKQMRGENRQNRARDEFGTHSAEYITVGWSACCKCDAGEPVPCTVLDPFAGAGTTGLVATRLHRNFIGIELNADYITMASRRIEQDAPLFNTQEATTEISDSRVRDPVERSHGARL